MNMPVLIGCLVSASLAGLFCLAARPTAWVLFASLIAVMAGALIALYRHAERVRRGEDE